HVFKAINLLKSVGAVPVVAHPLTVKVPDMPAFLQSLAQAGLRGVEVEYDYKPVGIDASLDEVRRITRELSLIETGGSDYHGDSWMGNLGGTTVPIEAIKKLREAADESNTQG
ncbi:MAG: hypothetical protein ACXABY_36065, partial [Candidatus Thorarchaeota archaeon]